MQAKKHEFTLMPLAVLLALYCWAFNSEIIDILRKGTQFSEAIQSLLAPIIITTLIYLRRDDFLRCNYKNSACGVLLIMLGIATYSLCSWPFSFGYARLLALVPILGGVILAVCGWRVFRLSLPLLAIMLISIPFSWSFYARLTLWLEIYTLEFSLKIFNLFGNLESWIDGTGVFFTLNDRTGTIALGNSYKGIRLVQLLTAIGIFVIFSTKRSFARICVCLFALLPIAMFCNLARFITLGLIEFAGIFTPISNFPRCMATGLSILLMYALMLLFSNLNVNLFVEEEFEDA